MLWRRRGSAGWRPSASWGWLILVAALSLTASTALCQEPSSERPLDAPALADSTVTLTRADLLILLDDIAYLEADLSECRTRLEWAQETPPECADGVPWLLVIASAAAGGLAIAVLD